MNKKIKDLQKQIELEKSKINNCKHNWGKPFYNPETVREPYGYKIVGQGSDVWSEPEGYKDVQKARWTRTCTICEKEEHTYKQKPVINNYTPDFK